MRMIEVSGKTIDAHGEDMDYSRMLVNVGTVKVIGKGINGNAIIDYLDGGCISCNESYEDVVGLLNRF